MLVYGWLTQPTATVEQLAQMAGQLGIDVSPQAIDQRFTPATADLLQQVLLASIQQVIAADSVALPILQRFTSIRVHDMPDALTATWRGCGNTTSGGTAGLKCGVQLDLLTGAITGLDLAAGRAADQALPVQHADFWRPVRRPSMSALGVCADPLRIAGRRWLSTRWRGRVSAGCWPVAGEA